MSIQLKRSLTSEISSNYILKQGQVGIEMQAATNSQSSPFRMKIGDGITQWSSLPYFGESKEVDLSSVVPTYRKINNKALTSDISLTYSDVGAAAADHTHDAPITPIGAVWKLASEYGILPNDNTAATKINAIGPTSSVKGIAFPEGTYVISANATFYVPVYAAPGAVFQIESNVSLNFYSTFESSGNNVFVLAEGGKPVFHQSTIEYNWFQNRTQAFVLAKDQHLQLHAKSGIYPEISKTDVVTNSQYVYIVGDESGSTYHPRLFGGMTVDLPNTGDSATIIIKDVNIQLTINPFITITGNFYAELTIKLINVHLDGTGSLLYVNNTSGAIQPRLYFENVTGSENSDIFYKDSEGVRSFYWHNPLNSPDIGWQTIVKTDHQAKVAWETDFENINLISTSGSQISFGCGTLKNCTFSSKHAIPRGSSGGYTHFIFYPNLASNFNNISTNLVFFNCNFDTSQFAAFGTTNTNRHKIIFLCCTQVAADQGPSGYIEGWPAWATVLPS